MMMESGDGRKLMVRKSDHSDHQPNECQDQKFCARARSSMTITINKGWVLEKVRLLCLVRMAAG